MFNSEVLVGLLVLAAGATPVAARALYPRACTFTGPAAAGDTCKTMAAGWGVSEADFISWNPGADCNALVPGQEYCVEWDLGSPPPVTTTAQTITSPPVPTTTAPVKPSPTQEGLISDCNISCSVITNPLALVTDSTSQARASIRSSAATHAPRSGPRTGTSSLWMNCEYPSFPRPAHFDIIILIMPAPATPGTRLSVPVRLSSSHNQSSPGSWPAWFGNVLTTHVSVLDCGNLWLDYYVCVGLPSTVTTTSAPTTTTSKPVTTTAPSGPSPTQGGIAADCQRYHKVASGDTCQKIVDTYKTFTLSNFYSWNPDVGNGKTLARLCTKCCPF